MRAHEVLEYVIMKSQPDEDTSCWALFEVVCDGDLGKWISFFVLLQFIAHTWCLNEMLCPSSFTVSPFCGYLSLVFFIDHLRSCVVYNFGHVCMSLSVHLSDDNFRKPWGRKFIFAHAAYPHGLRVKFIYEGHRVTVKVTGAKKVENSYSHDVKLWSAVSPIYQTYRHDVCVQHGVFAYGGSNGVAAIFVMWSELNTHN